MPGDSHGGSRRWPHQPSSLAWHACRQSWRAAQRAVLTPCLMMTTSSEADNRPAMAHRRKTSTQEAGVVRGRASHSPCAVSTNTTHLCCPAAAGSLPHKPHAGNGRQAHCPPWCCVLPASRGRRCCAAIRPGQAPPGKDVQDRVHARSAGRWWWSTGWRWRPSGAPATDSRRPPAGGTGRCTTAPDTLPPSPWRRWRRCSSRTSGHVRTRSRSSGEWRRSWQRSGPGLARTRRCQASGGAGGQPRRRSPLATVGQEVSLACCAGAMAVRPDPVVRRRL